MCPRLLLKTKPANGRVSTCVSRCAPCQRPRPSDPFCGFRAQCGPSLPVLDEQRRRPAEGGQVPHRCPWIQLIDHDLIY